MPLYYVNRVCDRRRWNKELKQLFEADKRAYPLYSQMWKDGDDGTRLVLADLAEETGFHYLAMFLRKMMTCKKPRRRRRRRAR